MPNITVQNSNASLRVLLADVTDLARNRPNTNLTESIVSGGTTIRVQSLVGFEQLSTSSGQIVLIGTIGNERSEILRTSSTTSPSYAYKEVTLTDALNFDHPQDTQVTLVEFNRIEFDYSATSTGAKTTITTYPVAIQADTKGMYFKDTTEPVNRVGSSTVFYFARFNSSLTENRSSDWSDPVQSTGYNDNSVYAIKKRALDESGEEIDGNIITHEYLNQSLWAARREFHNENGKRPFRQKFNIPIGSVLTGSYRIELPSDVESPFGPQNIYGVRVGANSNMRWMDKKDWDAYYVSKPHSTLDVPYVVNTSTSIWLANGRDFSASATINVEGASVGLSRITGSQNSFKIITHGSYSASAGSDAWENINLGLPDRFTVWADPQGSAYVYFNRPFDTSYINQNIYADYYRTVVAYDTDADVLDEPEYDMFVDYLKFKIKERKSRGQIAVSHSRSGQVYIADADFQTWLTKKNSALQGEYISNQIHLNPGISHLSIPNDYSSFNYN